MTEEELKALGEACAADEKDESPVVGSNRVQEVLDRILKLPVDDQLMILQALLDSLDS